MDRWLSSCEAAAYIGVSKKTLLLYCKRRQITFTIHPSGAYRFRQSALDVWLASRTVAGGL
jgi:excisionase family DNA binding protein